MTPEAKEAIFLWSVVAAFLLMCFWLLGAKADTDPKITYDLWLNEIISQGTLPNEEFIAQKVRQDHQRCGLELKAKVRELSEIKRILLEKRP